MTSRTYDQFCGVARALDLVGERWALLVVRDLILGPKRFTDLRRGLPGIGTNVLAARLRELERGGVIERRMLPPPAASGLTATVALRFADGAFRARIEDGALEVESGVRNGADLVLTTEVETLIAFLAGADVPPAALAPEGDTSLLERLPDIFAFGAIV